MRPDAKLDVHVVAFSSAHDLPEQVASIRSFLRFVGAPRTFTVASDGSHTPADRRILQRLHPSVEVMDWNQYARADLPERVVAYAAVSPMGKKLAVIASLRAAPTLYVDSDVLFFPGAREALAREALAGRRSAYQTQGWADGYVHELLSEAEGDPVNAGFIVVAGPLNWEKAFSVLPETPSADHLYLEQTLVHIAMREAGASALPIHAFPLHNHDEFLFRDAHDPRRTALRHYVSVTRPKFWLALSRQSTIFPATAYIPTRFTQKAPPTLGALVSGASAGTGR